MTAKQLQMEHLSRVLSDKPILERFLCVLLNKQINLNGWPEEAAWNDISSTSDIHAVTVDGMHICVHVNVFGVEPLIDELKHSAVKLGASSVCSIILSDADPVALGQAYSRIAPVVINTPVVSELESRWQIHILSCSPNIITRNAPEEIQQLLDHLSGKKIEPASRSLLNRMLHEDFVLCWLNYARNALKKEYRAEYDESAKEIVPCCLDLHMRNYSHGFINAYTDVDVYINLLQDLIDDAKSKEELIVSCQAAHIPLEMLLDFVSGDIWTKDELLQWYQEALAEERKKRRASAEKR